MPQRIEKITVFWKCKTCCTEHLEEYSIGDCQICHKTECCTNCSMFLQDIVHYKFCNISAVYRILNLVKTKEAILSSGLVCEKCSQRLFDMMKKGEFIGNPEKKADLLVEEIRKIRGE